MLHVYQITYQKLLLFAENILFILNQNNLVKLSAINVASCAEPGLVLKKTLKSQHRRLCGAKICRT